MGRVEKIGQFEGLRGILCIIVIIHHFSISFFVNNPYPQLLLSDGNFAVMAFLFLSGYLVNLKVLNTENNITFKSFLNYVKRRYCRLLPTIAIVVLFSGILFFTGNIRTTYAIERLGLSAQSKLATNFLDTEIQSVTQVLYEAFVGAFISRPYLNPPFWTIKYELWGCAFCYVVSFVKKTTHRDLIYITLILLCYYFGDIYLSCVMGGGYLSDILNNSRKRKIFKNIPKEGNIYFVAFLLIYTLNRYIANSLIGFLALVMMFDSIYYESVLKRILMIKALQRIGEYSFEIYAIHWLILCTISCDMMVWLMSYLNWSLSFSLCIVFTVIVSIIAAVIFKYIIGKARTFEYIGKARIFEYKGK